jgi:hypothetical protein
LAAKVQNFLEKIFAAKVRRSEKGVLDISKNAKFEKAFLSLAANVLRTINEMLIVDTNDDFVNS